MLQGTRKRRSQDRAKHALTETERHLGAGTSVENQRPFGLRRQPVLREEIPMSVQTGKSQSQRRCSTYFSAVHARHDDLLG